MKVGVLGMGSIGQRHARNLELLGHTIMPYDPVRYGYERDDVLREADAFVIASPTPCHYQDILDCAARNKPMLIEKPIIDPNRDRLDHVKEALAGRNDVFMGFNLRFNPCVQAAYQEVMAGSLKQPKWAHFCVAQYTDKPDYLRDGVVSNWASHEIDLALFLLGPARVIAAAGDDTICDIILRHDSGCQTTVHADYVTTPELRWFGICGPSMLRANIVSRDSWLDDTIRGRSTATSDDEYKQEAQMFHFSKRGLGSSRLAHWEDGVNVCEIVIEARERMGLT